MTPKLATQRKFWIITFIFCGNFNCLNLLKIQYWEHGCHCAKAKITGSQYGVHRVWWYSKEKFLKNNLSCMIKFGVNFDWKLKYQKFSELYVSRDITSFSLPALPGILTVITRANSTMKWLIELYFYHGLITRASALVLSAVYYTVNLMSNSWHYWYVTG